MLSGRGAGASRNTNHRKRGADPGAHAENDLGEEGSDNAGDVGVGDARADLDEAAAFEEAHLLGSESDVQANSGSDEPGDLGPSDGAAASSSAGPGAAAAGPYAAPMAAPPMSRTHPAPKVRRRKQNEKSAEAIATIARYVEAILRDPAFQESTPRMHVDIALQRLSDAGESMEVWGPSGAYSRRRTALDVFLQYDYAALAARVSDPAGHT